MFLAAKPVLSVSLPMSGSGIEAQHGSKCEAPHREHEPDYVCTLRRSTPSVVDLDAEESEDELERRENQVKTDEREIEVRQQFLFEEEDKLEARLAEEEIKLEKRRVDIEMREAAAVASEAASSLPPPAESSWACRWCRRLGLWLLQILLLHTFKFLVISGDSESQAVEYRAARQIQRDSWNEAEVLLTLCAPVMNALAEAPEPLDDDCDCHGPEIRQDISAMIAEDANSWMTGTESQMRADGSHLTEGLDVTFLSEELFGRDSSSDTQPDQRCAHVHVVEEQEKRRETEEEENEWNEETYATKQQEAKTDHTAAILAGFCMWALRLRF